MDEILTRIDTLRKERKWSYYMLALEAGLTQSTITNMFYRNTQPSIKTLKALCAAFGISVAEFFEPLEKSTGSHFALLDNLSKEECSLINSYRHLSKEDQKSVNQLLEKYANQKNSFDKATLSDYLNEDNKQPSNFEHTELFDNQAEVNQYSDPFNSMMSDNLRDTLSILNCDYNDANDSDDESENTIKNKKQ